MEGQPAQALALHETLRTQHEKETQREPSVMLPPRLGPPSSLVAEIQSHPSETSKSQSEQNNGQKRVPRNERMADYR